MNKIGTYLLYGGALVFAIALIWISVSPNKKNQSSESNMENNSQKVEVQESKPAEKVQVYVFHSTNRCYSCVTMGEYTKATVEEFFQPELRDGKIEFREINVDLPANKEVATKFKAVGSSLFINAIIDGKDNIKEEVRVWRLLGNKPAFSDYLTKKIRGLIGEIVSAETRKKIESKDIAFYTGDTCPGCDNVEKFFKDNDVKNKLTFEEKNIDKNETDAEQMAEDAMQCNVDPESFGVPFLCAQENAIRMKKISLIFLTEK